MSGLRDAKAFLDAMAYQHSRGEPPDLQRGRYPFLTISRQAGAGGHTLAETLRQTLECDPDPLWHGWQVFDQALCTTLLQDPSLHVSLQSLLTEAYRTEIEELIFHLLLFGRETPQDVVVKKLFGVIRTLATVGKVIIVGRAGACVTRSLPLGVHLRLAAPEPVRVRRLMHLLGTGEPEALRAVRRQDADRARLVDTYFGRAIDDPLLYDATWNTETVAFEAIAAATLALLKARVHAPQPAAV